MKTVEIQTQTYNLLPSQCRKMEDGKYLVRMNGEWCVAKFVRVVPPQRHKQLAAKSA